MSPPDAIACNTVRRAKSPMVTRSSATGSSTTRSAATTRQASTTVDDPSSLIADVSVTNLCAALRLIEQSRSDPAWRVVSDTVVQERMHSIWDAISSAVDAYLDWEAGLQHAQCLMGNRVQLYSVCVRGIQHDHAVSRSTKIMRTIAYTMRTAILETDSRYLMDRVPAVPLAVKVLQQGEI